MSALDIVLEAYRDNFGTKTERANEIHRTACAEVARLLALETRVQELEAAFRQHCAEGGSMSKLLITTETDGSQWVPLESHVSALRSIVETFPGGKAEFLTDEQILKGGSEVICNILKEFFAESNSKDTRIRELEAALADAVKELKDLLSKGPDDASLLKEPEA